MFSTVLKQALTTFTTKPELLYQNIDALKTLLEKTTADDVNLHRQFLTDTLWKRPEKAPVTYVDIYEDANLTVGIFILKPGMRLPLHNHPEMHGMIKVIAGRLKVTSYSANTEKTRAHARPGAARFPTVERSRDSLVDEHSGCCVLTPDSENFHEIESVAGPAAFIDILAPPYETVGPSGRERKCCYYQVLRELAPDVFRLQETCSPSWYWSDTFPYTGPELGDET